MLRKQIKQNCETNDDDMNRNDNKIDNDDEGDNDNNYDYYDEMKI